MDLVKWKVAKTTVLSLSVIAFGIYAIQNGADAGLTMFATNVVVALIAGIEFSELAAALAEVDTEN